MILVWLLLLVGYTVCCVIVIPPETLRRYRNAPKDWQYYTAHALFYSIPLSWFLREGQSTSTAILSGILVFAVGGALNIWAMASNPHFLPNIEIPVRVISGGAYSWFDHPGYVGMGLMAAGSWLMVGRSLVVIPLVVYLGLIMWRARQESRLIQYKS